MIKTLVTQKTKGWTVLHLKCIENDLICFRAVFHKFGKIFKDDSFMILNFCDFKLSVIDQGIHKHAIQKKKDLGEKKKKPPILTYPGLRYAKKKFSEKVCLRTKFDLRFKKNNKFLRQICKII